jgi:alpha-amylase/alpha-mannosidase (GH57 family)
MPPISLAFFWHQHQPYYPDDVSGETLMPWVRLHGTKDYYGMALHIKEVPEFRCSINLVPSLLLQLQGYAEHGRSDRHLDVSRLPADGFSQVDGQYLLDNFFMASVENMIRPYPRYYELYQKRGFGLDSAEKALPRFSERDIRDLQIWSNLSWMHELAFEGDSDLRAFRQKGRHWTEQEKQWLLAKQLEILRAIIPLHRELSEGGQVELTTTPFYHPILPLLWDKRSARQAMPGCELPRFLDSYQDDVQIHLERAVAYHKELFGSAPAGMWPSEGSVSQEIIPSIAQQGIRWIATDEEILSNSLGGRVARDSQGYLRNPELLYRPWLLEEKGQQLQIVFRDHGLSDLIGFHYQRSQPAHAAGDMLGKVESIGRSVSSQMGDRPALVPVILDGENCWEYYPDGGVEFLRTLYRECVKHPHIKPARISDYLNEHPATDRIPQLFAGSWISHNFAIWIGHAEDREAWDLLHQTRQFLIQAKDRGDVSPADSARAWEEIYIAEGSDWCWWYGEDHSSALDSLFDQLFRKHLQNVYMILGVPPPSQLNRPISRGQQRILHSLPRGFLEIKVDGRRSYFEWLNAGQYVAGSERGTMAMVSAGLIKEVHFGFDLSRLMIRCDTTSRAADDLRHAEELRIGFVEPSGYVLRIWRPGQPTFKVELYRDNVLVPNTKTEYAADQIVELTVDFNDLGLKPDARIQMYVEVLGEKQSLDRAPREGYLEMSVPSADFERIMWQA